MPDPIKKIVIGASTYGSIPRINSWIKSLWSNMEEIPGIDVSILVCDDGTPDSSVVRQRAQFCRSWNVQFLHNEKNLGIPATWNRICSAVPDADLVFVSNDDIRFLMPGWLTRLIYFFTRNDNVGMVGLPLVSDMGFKDDDPRWWGTPGRVGAAVGCAFAVRPKDIFAIENPDGSKGFWFTLVSFHEEIHMGFKLAEAGRLSYMLPFPPAFHHGGATFGSSPELTWREPSDYLSKDEFLNYARSSQWYIKEFEEQYSKNIVDRMMYSRAMFAKYWGILDLPRKITLPGWGEEVDVWDEPQKYVHEKVVEKWPGRTIKWLTRDGEEKEFVDR